MMPLVPDIPEIRSDVFDLLGMPDGRDLAFMQWGDPAGFPAFYFHGTPSSRLEGAFADAAAREHGFRLIAVDRPGYGRSSFQPGRTFSHWPADVLRLADHFELNRFGVVGHSGAGPHLFACGTFLDPARLAFIGALGPWAPLVTQEARSSINRLDRFYMKLAGRMPFLMRAAFAPVGWTARYGSKLFMRALDQAVSPADKAMLQNRALREGFASVQREAFRQGGKGAAHEALIAYQPWGFDVARVQVPTFIWLGDEDVFVPNAMGHYLQKTIPQAQLHLMPGKGHLNIDDWHRILAACSKVL